MKLEDSRVRWINYGRVLCTLLGRLVHWEVTATAGDDIHSAWESILNFHSNLTQWRQGSLISWKWSELHWLIAAGVSSLLTTRECVIVVMEAPAMDYWKTYQDWCAFHMVSSSESDNRWWSIRSTWDGIGSFHSNLHSQFGMGEHIISTAANGMLTRWRQGVPWKWSESELQQLACLQSMSLLSFPWMRRKTQLRVVVWITEKRI